MLFTSTPVRHEGSGRRREAAAVSDVQQSRLAKGTPGCGLPATLEHRAAYGLNSSSPEPGTPAVRAVRTLGQCLPQASTRDLTMPALICSKYRR